MIHHYTLTALCLCAGFAPFLHALEFSAPLTDKYVILGTPLWWTCSVIKTPQTPTLTFFWRFQNGDIQNDQTRTAYGNGTLYFRRIQNSELGQYTCIVTNAEGIIESSAWLREAYATASSISLEPSNQVVITGNVAVLECKIDARPAPVILWMKDGNVIKETARVKITEVAMGHSMLQIFNTTYADAGSFTCNVSHISLTQSLTSPTAVVNVNGPPTIILRPQSQVVPVGFNVTFKCSVMSEPLSQVVWTFQQTGSSVSFSLSSIQPSVSINALNGSLFLTGVDESDSGMYTCSWSNQFGSDRAQATLTVQGQPQLPAFINGPSDKSLEEGGTLILNCSGSGNPVPSAQWTHPNGAILSKDVINDRESNQEGTSSSTQLQERVMIDDEGTLFLQNVSRTDRGFYTCKLVNSLGGIESRVFVDVLFIPYFTVAPQSTAVNAGASFTLLCESSGNPAPTVTWSLPSNPNVYISVSNAGLNSGKNEIVLNNGSLRVLTASVIHNGVYSCTASNQVGSEIASVTVTVSGLPHFAIKPMSQGVIEGDRVVLHCQIDSFPSATVVWYTKYMVDPGIQATDIMQLKNSLSNGADLNTENMTLIQPGSESRYNLVNGTSLEITNVTESHAGLYICTATNNIGYVFEPAILRVITFPSFQVIPSDKKAAIGSNVLLDCYSVGIPVPTQRWLFNSSKMHPNPRMNVFENGSLLIQNVETSDFGLYTCLATNQAGQRSVSARLTFTNLPYFTTKPTNVTSVEGSNVTLICRGESESSIEARWYLSNTVGEPVRLLGQTIVNTVQDGTTSSNLQTNTGTKSQITREGDLYFDCIEESDAAWYMCSLRNSEGQTDSNPAYLTVYYAPLDLKMTFLDRVFESQGIVLSCEARGSPAADISWVTPLKEELSGVGGDGITITSDQNSNIVVSSLTIRAVRNRVHGGEWECKACNSIGCSLTRKSLNIDGGPVVRDISAMELELEYKISCISVGNPTSDITYAANNVPITNLTDGHRLIGNDLYVEKDLLKDEYSCTATNIFGSIMYNFFNPSSISIEPGTPASNSIPLSMSSTFPIPHLMANQVILQYKEVGSTVWQTQTLVLPADLKNYFEVEKGTETNATGVTCQNGDSIANRFVRSSALVSSQTPQVSIRSDGTAYEYSIKAELENLTPNTRYDIKSALSNILGPGPFSLPIQVTTLTAAPNSVTDTAVNVMNRTAVVSWTNPDPLNGRPEDINIVIVLLDSDSKSIEEVTVSVMDPSTVSFPGLKLGGYSMEIYASNTETNTTGKSVVISFQIEDQPSQYVPQIEEIKAMDANTLVMNWTVPLKPDELIPEVSGYVISVAQTDGEQTEEAFEINDATISTFTINERQEYTKYSIRIASKNSKGTGPYSQTKTAMTPYSEFSELALEGTESDHDISWGHLAIILIVIFSAFMLLAAIVVISHQMKLARSKSVDLTPHPDYPYIDNTYNDISYGENDNDRNDMFQNESYQNDRVQNDSYQSDPFEGRRNEAFVLY